MIQIDADAGVFSDDKESIKQAQALANRLGVRVRLNLPFNTDHVSYMIFVPDKVEEQEQSKT